MKKTILFFALALGMLPMALEAQTKNVARECVLFELFTGVRCPYCPAAANGVAQMLDEGLAIAPVAYHTSAFSTDLYYTDETNARASYYSISSYPTLKADGITGMSGGGDASQNMYPNYRNYYNQRINVESPFTIDLSYEPVEGNTCRVNYTVNQVGECNGTNVRVFIALTQCNIDVSWQGMQGLHHVCRDMIPSQTGTPFTGPTMNISETFEMNWPKEDCYLTAWVQNYSGGTKEVYQTVRLSMALDLDYDLVLKNVESVVDQNCSGVQSPRLIVKNYGHETVTSFVMRAFDGVNSYSQTWEGSLAEGETVEAMAKALGYSLPASDFETVSDLITAFFAAFVRGDENCGGNSPEGKLFLDAAYALFATKFAEESPAVKAVLSSKVVALLGLKGINNVFTRAALDKILTGIFVDKAPGDNDVTLPGYEKGADSLWQKIADFFAKIVDFFRGFFAHDGAIC